MATGALQGIALKFSVVIPVYNGSHTIARAIDAVLAQSYTNFELIVVDDAGTDDSKEKAAAYGNKVKLIVKPINEGSAAARNTGIDAATGDYIAFLDADDIWQKDKLMLLHIALTANPHISLLYHPYTLADVAQMKLPEALSVYQVPFKKLLPRNLVATSCMVIRNDPSFRFEPSMRYTEDFDLALRVSYIYGLYFIDLPLTQIFRPFTSQGGISSNKWKMRMGEMRAYARFARLHPVFLLPLPFLLLYSLAKHGYKALAGMLGK